jgi:HEAT repeat protein
MIADDNALKIFNLLVHGRESERATINAALKDPSKPLNRRHLRYLIQSALHDEFYPGREVEEQDKTIAWTRSWLVNMLGKISDDDAQAAATVRRHLDPKYETFHWVRYWALESLISTDAPDLVAIAQGLRNDEELLIKMLSRAVLAARDKDEKARRQIEEALAGSDLGRVWATLRALRLVPITATFQKICEIVEGNANSDETYDAIIALCRVPPGSTHAQCAAGTLTNLIRKSRPSPWLDGMRTAALRTLGDLRAESVAPLLVEELLDDNPAVVREAAVALRKVVGIRTAASRVVEAAGRNGGERAEAFASALRWMERDAVVEELESTMLSGLPEHQEAARRLLSEIGGVAAMQKLRARTSAVAQYSAEMEKAEEKIRNLFESSIREARLGFRLASLMDVLVFALGLGLIGVSAGLVLARGGELNNWAGVGLTGGVGVLGVLYGILIAKPRKQVLEAVDHLMHLKVVFLGYLRQLHQADQTYTRRLLEEKPLGSEEANQFSRNVDATMRAAVEQMLAARAGLPRQRARTAKADPPPPAPSVAGNGKVEKPGVETVGVN